jgi:hypothetical protein
LTVQPFDKVALAVMWLAPSLERISYCTPYIIFWFNFENVPRYNLYWSVYTFLGPHIFWAPLCLRARARACVYVRFRAQNFILTSIPKQRKINSTNSGSTSVTDIGRYLWTHKMKSELAYWTVQSPF